MGTVGGRDKEDFSPGWRNLTDEQGQAEHEIEELAATMVCVETVASHGKATKNKTK